MPYQFQNTHEDTLDTPNLSAVCQHCGAHLADGGKSIRTAIFHRGQKEATTVWFCDSSCMGIWAEMRTIREMMGADAPALPAVSTPEHELALSL